MRGIKVNSTIRSVRILVVILITIELFAVGANAAIMIDFSAVPGASTVSMSISGSGTWGSSITDDIILYDNIAGTFADAGLAIGDGNLYPLNKEWVALNQSFMVLNNGTFIAFDRIYIQDEGGSGDDLSLGTSFGNFSSVAGQVWSIAPQTVTFEIGNLGDPDSNATFDNLGPGTHAATIYSGSHQTGDLTLSVATVPEPMSAFLLIALVPIMMIRRNLCSSQKSATGKLYIHLNRLFCFFYADL